MLNEAEKRAADWVVARYGLDRGQVDQLIEWVLQARAKGKPLDLFDALLRERLLLPAQVQDLRLALDSTRISPRPEGDPRPTNGSAPPEPSGARTLPPQTIPPLEHRGESIPDLRVLGDYRLLRRLGEGGMGSVFLGYHEEKNEYVALKVLAPNLAKNQDLLDRFKREQRSGAHLNHPNIVRNLGIGLDPGSGLHYLILEYVDGPNGLELLNRFGRLFVADAVHVILDVARALEHAHSRNIIHRDIKPGNILITQSGMAKLSDLGLSKRTDDKSPGLTHARQSFGTPYYMPYEQALNATKADHRSDLYALGATFYHFLVGEVPFQGNNTLEIVDKKNVGIFTPASVLNTDVPAVLDRILEKLLARGPEDRYQTASELIVDLERSNLAASVPSFINPDKALEDPQMRQRLLSPPPATEHDLRKQPPGANAGSANIPLWFLRYFDRHGQLCKAKEPTEQVLERLRKGSLPRETEASRKPNGDFQPLASFVEFAPFFHEQAQHGLIWSTSGEEGPVTIWGNVLIWIALAILAIVGLTAWLIFAE